jgi:baculoviral IAP repeat-containing protein 2/3
VNDDPAEVHARLAPHCPFVLSISPIEHLPKIINDNLNQKFQPSHPTMAEVSCRQATFSKITWAENLPSIEDLVRAGFFFSGVENTVTCFYCNGSLHKWGSNDNPMIEHARWFPHCIYAKHICGDQLYGKIQISKKRHLIENKINQNELSRLVAARLDLPIVERLRSQYKLAIIKRCIEDQLTIKNDDFASDTDLTMACLILQKQIDIIKGCKDKIIIPSTNQQLKTSSELSKKSLGECLICLTEEKQLACMPCGHLCACVPCGYSLRSCPICRQNIESFMRINS